VLLAVASNKFQEGTEHLIKEFFPEISFVAILGSRPNFPLKPSPEIVGEILKKSGIQREEAVMVGDSETDMETAINGGIDGIAVSWGYRNVKDLADKWSALRPFDPSTNSGLRTQGPQNLMIANSAEELLFYLKNC
jgi:phosphoglycolate phosphatase